MPETVEDVFGNKVWNGKVEFNQSEFGDYLPDDDVEEFIGVLRDLGITVTADDGGTTRDNETYAYTVDWGDGSEPCEFLDYDTTPEAWYHTYEKPGTYDVTINGIFRSMYNLSGENGQLVVDGEYFFDVDGSPIYTTNNYGCVNHCVKVIAWGNTRLKNLSHACNSMYALTSIPITDTTASFTDVVSCEQVFRLCRSLSSFPYDSNTGRGLFSNMPNVLSFDNAFDGCTGITSSIPPALIDNCPLVTTIASMFQDCKNLTGELPVDMFQGLSGLTTTEWMFINCQKLTGTIPSTLFDDCPELVNTAGMFMACTGLTGIIPAGLFKNCSKLVQMDNMFARCSSITGIEAGVFEGLPTDDTEKTMRMMFARTGIAELPDGVFDGLSGSGTCVGAMFANCSSLSAVSSTLLEQCVGFKDCVGVVGGCPITSQTPSMPSTGVLDSPENIERFKGFFGDCSDMGGFDTLAAELGGGGARMFPGRHVNSIMLSDKTFVETHDFVYDSGNKPVGFCFASDDEYDYVIAWNASINSHCTQLSRNSFGEILLKIDLKPIISCYSPRSGETLNNVIFTNEWYQAHKAECPAWQACEQYVTDGTNPGDWKMPECRDAYETLAMFGSFKAACDKVVAESGGEYTSATCYPYVIDVNDMWTCDVSVFGGCVYDVDRGRVNIPNALWVSKLCRFVLRVPRSAI